MNNNELMLLSLICVSRAWYTAAYFSVPSSSNVGQKLLKHNYEQHWCTGRQVPSLHWRHRSLMSVSPTYTILLLLLHINPQLKIVPVAVSGNHWPVFEERHQWGRDWVPQTDGGSIQRRILLLVLVISADLMTIRGWPRPMSEKNVRLLRKGERSSSCWLHYFSSSSCQWDCLVCSTNVLLKYRVYLHISPKLYFEIFGSNNLLKVIN